MKKSLLFLALSSALNAQALEIQGGFGQFRFSVERDGMFYNADQPHSLYLTPRGGSLALADKFGQSRWGWRIAYIESGAIQVRDAKARVVDGSHEVAYPCNPSVTWWGCHATFNSRGGMYGFSAGITYEQPLISNISIVPELGLLHFRSILRSEITPVDYHDKVIYSVQDSGWSNSPAPYVGVMLKQHLPEKINAYFGPRYYYPQGHRALSVTNHGFLSWTFELGKEF